MTWRYYCILIWELEIQRFTKLFFYDHDFLFSKNHQNLLWFSDKKSFSWFALYSYTSLTTCFFVPDMWRCFSFTSQQILSWRSWRYGRVFVLTSFLSRLSVLPLFWTRSIIWMRCRMSVNLSWFFQLFTVIRKKYDFSKRLSSFH